jgi:hypothetical protein
MATTSTSAAVAAVEPVFTGAAPANRKPRGCGGTREATWAWYPGGLCIAGRGCQRAGFPSAAALMTA